jgi:N6-L-threonylcarbamoyladenine synthase
LPLLLAIESSCDETAAAVVRDGHEVLSSAVATQIEIHRKFGGVVPELASRNHVVDAVPVVRDALAAAGVTLGDIDALAVTQGPGLVGALLVGLQVAKALAFVHDKPLIPVHHLAGHLHGVFLHRPDEPRPAGPAFPHVALCVSGGHTALYRVEAPEVDASTRIRLLAQTRDDAAGEAFDKVSRMLGLGYPGGPIIEQRALGGDPRAHRFSLPRFKDDAPFDFSFSGLKTAVLTVIQHTGRLPEGQALTNLLASFQQAAVDQLVERTCAVARQQGVTDVQIAGGVASNRCLRETMAAALAAEGVTLHVPPPRYCTDNAAMIAGAADFAAARVLAGPPAGRRADLALNARPTWPLASASP